MADKREERRKELKAIREELMPEQTFIDDVDDFDVRYTLNQIVSVIDQLIDFIEEGIEE